MKNYKKNDPRMWWYYTKVGRTILAIILIAVIISVILKAIGIIN